MYYLKNNNIYIKIFRSTIMLKEKAKNIKILNIIFLKRLY